MFLTIANVSDILKELKGENMSLSMKPKTWENKAACLGFPAEIFYPEDSQPESSRQALDICRSCPVRVKCLDAAITRNETEGIWGGTLPAERRYIRRKKTTATAYLRTQCGSLDGYWRHKRTNQSICKPCQSSYNRSFLNKAGQPRNLI